MIPVDPRGRASLPALSEQGQTQPPDAGDFQVHQRKLRLQSECDVVGALNVLRRGRTGPSAHNKKHIAHVVSIGEQGFRPKDSMPSMGTALEPRDRVVQGIPAL